jgi:hypothetical protein
MAEALKVLGQVSPAATTLTALYTVPAATSATSSTLVVCNQNATAITFRISVAVAGAADNVKQYVAYDARLIPNSSITLTLGITLATTDLVRVYASATGVSFNLFGVEVS